jgi:flagellar motor switch protein FliN/FliY
MNHEVIRKVFGNVLLDVVVELGRKPVCIGEMLKWDKGTIIKFEKTSGESVDFLVNNRPLASGEIMVLEDKFAVRITDILTREGLTDIDKDGLYE